LILVAMHHIVSDGWSVSVFIGELASLYEALSTDRSRGEAVKLEELPVQYADYAVWQRKHLQGEALDRLLSYWRRELADPLPTLDLRADRPRPPIQTFRGGVETFALSRELSGAIGSLSRAQGATLFIVLLAAFKLLLSRYSGQDEIVVGSPTANRNRTEVEGLIGFFVNILIMRTDLSGDPSFLDLLKRVRATALGAYVHQDLPFEKLVEELQPERDLSRNPLFQVMFAVQTPPLPPLAMSDITVTPIEMETGDVKFDLGVYVWESPDGIAGRCEYCADLYDAATVRRMVAHFQNLIEAIVAKPDGRITTMPVAGLMESRQILVDFNAAKREYDANASIQKIIAAQASIRPDAPAVEHDGRTINYGELNGKANRLANYLRAMKVGAEVPVGLCVERSVEMVVALLAIFKSGGVYVPLDATYPDQRLAF